MNIKYPKTELMVVLGSKVYPLYVTATTEEIENNMQITSREDFLTFETAIKKDHGNGLRYPGCDEEPIWTKWTVQKRAIKSYLELPKPKVNIDYSNQENRW